MHKRMLLPALVAAFALSACGGSSSSTASSPSPAPSDPPTAATAIATATATASAAAYTDMAGVFGADEILQLARLGAFDTTSGAFDPNATIPRRVFARWLFKANNAVWNDDDSKQFRDATAGETPAFKDVPNTDPDFVYIQGLQDAGVSVGFPDKTFRPDAPLSREQMLAIKSLVDYGGFDKAFAITKTDKEYGYYVLPAWKDKHDIAPEFVAPIATAVFDQSSKIDNVGRVFGAIAVIRPKAPVTRAQAALLLWKFGNHAAGAYSARTATDALAPATATP